MRHRVPFQPQARNSIPLTCVENPSQAVSAGLPNPNSKITLLRLSTGEMVLCYNASPSSRSHLRVAISPDALHWYQLAEIEVGRSGLSFSYPTMAQVTRALSLTLLYDCLLLD